MEEPKSSGKPTLDNLNTIDGLHDYFGDGGHIKLMAQQKIVPATTSNSKPPVNVPSLTSLASSVS